MVSESVIVAGIFTVIGAIVSAGTSLFNQRQSRQAASERLYDQHALEQKFKAYQDLYLSFDDVIARLIQANNEGIETRSTYREEIFEPYRELGIAWGKAKIYLDDEEEKKNLKQIYDRINENRIQLKAMAISHEDSGDQAILSRENLMDDEKLKEMREEMTEILRPKIDPSKGAD